MATRRKAKPEADAPLPPGWASGQREARVMAMRLLPRRVRVQLAAEWARIVLHRFEDRYPTDRRPRVAIEAAEAWVKTPDKKAAYSASAASAASAAADDARMKRWRWIYATYRNAHGTVGAVFAPEWRSETAVALARGIVADRAFDRMPILADALEEAGFDHPDELARLREPGDEFTCADWFLWNLLGWGEMPTTEGEK